jgi:hypothetical protein
MSQSAVKVLGSSYKEILEEISKYSTVREIASSLGKVSYVAQHLIE